MTADTVLTGKIVHIKKGIIHAIYDSTNWNISNEKLTVVDGQNGFLLPGLTDMHVHLWDRYELGLYLANGVTTIRNVWGLPFHLRLKKQIARNKLIGPQFLTTGPKLTGPEYIGDDNLQIFTPQEGKEKVRSYKKRGYDFIKTYNGLPEEIFSAILEEAQLLNMEVVAHPSHKVPYNFHFHPQIITIEHAEDIVQQPLNYQLDTLKLNDLVTAFASSEHTSFCPTLIVFYNIFNMLSDSLILNKNLISYINPAIKMLDSKVQINRWILAKTTDSTIVDRIKKQHLFHLWAIKQLHDAGVNIVCGTDAGIGITVPGFSIHQELALYQQAGLSNFEVIQTATVNVSKTHHLLNNIGTIEVGKTANLILLKKNPLQNLNALRKPQLVITNGTIITRKSLDNFEIKAKNRRNFLATTIRYLENYLVEQ